LWWTLKQNRHCEVFATSNCKALFGSDGGARWIEQLFWRSPMNFEFFWRSKQCPKVNFPCLDWVLFWALGWTWIDFDFLVHYMLGSWILLKVTIQRFELDKHISICGNFIVDARPFIECYLY
jgi:hypothetical protein